MQETLSHCSCNKTRVGNHKFSKFSDLQLISEEKALSSFHTPSTAWVFFIYELGFRIRRRRTIQQIRRSPILFTLTFPFPTHLVPPVLNFFLKNREYLIDDGIIGISWITKQVKQFYRLFRWNPLIPLSRQGADWSVALCCFQACQHIGALGWFQTSLMVCEWTLSACFLQNFIMAGFSFS